MSRSPENDEQQVIEWVENLLGGKVVECERQARWRPAWFLIVQRGAEQQSLYFRGDRGLQSGGQYQLEHEYSILKILGDSGIPVPKLHGFCETPRGILMDRVPGRAGRLHAGQCRAVRRRRVRGTGARAGARGKPELSMGMPPR